MSSFPDTLHPAPKRRDKNMRWPVLLFLLIGGLLAYIDKELRLNTLLLESVHTGVVAAIFLTCLYYERRYPHIRQFGWSGIVVGMAFLLFGTVMDLLDDPPMFHHLAQGLNFPLGPSWERAFLKKTLGYTTGIGLFAYGFFQWIPWMIHTRQDIHKLNVRLSSTNRDLNRALMSLDEHVESERVNISRELHDDVAQQLTFVNIQLQLGRKALESGDSARLPEVRRTLAESGTTLSEALKSVRQISKDLRPESLYSLGLVPALEQFLEKLQTQAPDTALHFSFIPVDAQATHTRIEKQTSDQQLLHLFRVVQEGTRNALKHARATEIHITLSEQSIAAPATTEPVPNRTCLTIRIRDNGRGLPWPEIPPDETLIAEGHLGIVGLKERVKALSGRFSLRNDASATGAILEIEIEA